MTSRPLRNRSTEMGALEVSLQPHEIETLTILMEECGEVIQAASKILRHGKHAVSSSTKKQYDNLDQLLAELGDVATCVEALYKLGFLPAIPRGTRPPAEKALAFHTFEFTGAYDWDVVPKEDDRG